jgi:hypothetical protein
MAAQIHSFMNGGMHGHTYVVRCACSPQVCSSVAPACNVLSAKHWLSIKCQMDKYDAF